MMTVLMFLKKSINQCWTNAWSWLYFWPRPIRDVSAGVGEPAETGGVPTGEGRAAVGYSGSLGSF